MSDTDRSPPPRRSSLLPFWLGVLGRIVFNIAGVYILSSFSRWVFTTFGFCVGLVVFGIGSAPLLPVTLILYPLSAAAYLALAALLVSYPVSTLGGLPVIEHPKECADWGTIALIYGLLSTFTSWSLWRGIL